MPGSGLGGLAEGLWGFVDKERAQAQERENKAAKQEADLYALLAEHGTEEFQAMGLSGMAEMANPKRKAKGMRGFLGEMEASQTLPKIRELMSQSTQRQVDVPGLPSKALNPALMMQGAPPAPTGGQGRMEAALAGQPPPAPAEAAAPPAGMDVLPVSQIGREGMGAGLRGQPPPAPGPAFTQTRGTPAVGRTDTVTEPRRVLMGSQERQLNEKRRALKAAGATDQEIEQALLADVGGRWGLGGAAGARAAGVREGNVHQDPTGQWVQDLYDPTGRVVSTIPAMDPRQTRPGSPNYSTAMNDTALREIGKPFAQATQDEAIQVYKAWRRDNPEAAGEVTTARETAKGAAQAVAPLSTQQRFQATGDLTAEWTKAVAPLKTIQEQVASLGKGMEAARRGDLAAGAEAVRVTFSKILDPNSVVMPGEFLRGNAALSWAAWVKGKIEQAQQGGIAIPLSDLETYAKLASDIEQAYGKYLEGDRIRIEKQAKEFGVDTAHIFGSAQTPSQKAAAAGAPPPGAAPALPAAPGAAATTPGAKTASLAEARAWAAAKGWTEQQAIADLQRRGYTVAPAQ